MASDRVTIRSDRTKGIPRIMALATFRSLKRAATTASAVLARALNKETGVKIKIIKRHISVSQPTPDHLETTIRVDGVPVPAIAYRQVQQTSTGVGFTTGGGSRAFLKGAFIATTKSGHRAVWSRHRPSRSRKNKPRSSPALPIFQRFGPPLSIVALRTEVLKSALAAGEESYQKNLRHELRRGLAGIGAQGAAA